MIQKCLHRGPIGDGNKPKPNQAVGIQNCRPLAEPLQLVDVLFLMSVQCFDQLYFFILIVQLNKIFSYLNKDCLNKDVSFCSILHHLTFK